MSGGQTSPKMTQGFTQTLPQNSFRTMKVFVLSKTNSTDTTCCFNQVFDTREKAVEKLRKDVQGVLDDNGDLVIDHYINTNGEKANVELDGFVVLVWNINECEVN